MAEEADRSLVLIQLVAMNGETIGVPVYPRGAALDSTVMHISSTRPIVDHHHVPRQGNAILQLNVGPCVSSIGLN